MVDLMTTPSAVPVGFDARRGRVADGLVALGLAALSLLAHLLLRTTMLYSWDSVLYVEALERFDVGQHRPQPPGYLFYVLAARLARDLGGLSPNDAYIAVSQVASAATVGVVYLVGRDLFGRPVGLVAALLAMTSVGLAIYTAVAYPYTVLALGSALLGWLCWWVGRRVAPAWLAGLALGVLSGFRQDLLIFLGPLVLVSVGVRSPRRLLEAAIAGGLGILAWFIPSAFMSGGIGGYVTALTVQSQRIERDTSVTTHGLSGLVANARSVVRYSVNVLSLSALPALLYAVVALLTPAGRRDRRAWHLAVWAGPAIIFYVFIHIGDIGYVLSFMPAVWLAAAAGLDFAARSIATWLRQPPAGRAWAITLALMVGLPIAFNLWWLLGTASPLSAQWLTCRDRQLAEAVAQVRATYPPATTALLTSGHYQQARHYLPEYMIWFHDPLNETVLRRETPPGMTAVVVFDWLLDGAPHARQRLLPLSCAYNLAVYETQPGDAIVVRPPRVELTP